MSTTIAATDQAKAAAAPRIRLLPHGFSIDHPDPELGEQLMANALGVADREAMDGVLQQLVKARRQEPRRCGWTHGAENVLNSRVRGSDDEPVNMVDSAAVIDFGARGFRLSE